jgi:hypothetical protein
VSSDLVRGDLSGFGGLVVSMLVVGFFGRKNPHHGEVKPSVPCRRFAAG